VTAHEIGPPGTLRARPGDRTGPHHIDPLGGGITTTIPAGRARCPLLRAAVRSGDPRQVAAVERWHPAPRCPAARQERARG
jgi:hypothetical protein